MAHVIFFSVHLASDPDNCCHHPVISTKGILDHSLLCKYYLHARIHYMRTRTRIFLTKITRYRTTVLDQLSHHVVVAVCMYSSVYRMF